ncbi:AsnC family transcriptional regulator, partial [Roseibium sp.]
MTYKLDSIDRKILKELQEDSRRSQREIADRVGLSQNACWRRLKAISESGLIKGHTIRLDPA